MTDCIGMQVESIECELRAVQESRDEAVRIRMFCTYASNIPVAMGALICVVLAARSCEDS